MAQADTSVSHRVEFSNGFASAKFTKQQSWTGENAATFRTNLDKLFDANSPGVLTSEEVTKILDAARNDTAANIGTLFMLDDANATTTNESVTIVANGLEGDVKSHDPVIVKHEIGLTFTPASGENHTFRMTMPVGGNVTILAPSGWHIETVDGLATPTFSEGDGKVEGVAAQGANLTIAFKPGGGREVNGGSTIPGPGLMLVVAGVGALALTRTRRART